jgi:hypothetical protein
VSESRLYQGLCAALEARHAVLKREQFFARLKAFMVICEPQEDARHLDGTTWLIQTPEHPEFGVLRIFFTWAPGQITLEAVVDDEGGLVGGLDQQAS